MLGQDLAYHNDSFAVSIPIDCQGFSINLKINTMSAHLLKRYVWLVDTVARAGAISYADINIKWQNSSLNEIGEELPKRTFNNHKLKVQELFDIDIVCDVNDGYRYSIEDTGELEASQTQQWLYNSFSISNVVNVANKVTNRIQLESVPSGNKYLQEIVEAIAKGKKISIAYHKYSTASAKMVLVCPYFIKLFKQRWYVIGLDETVNCLKTYALDRIKGLEPTNATFVYPANFNPADYYTDNFGIIHDEKIPTEKVILKVSKKQANYLNSLPLHHSQKLINGGTEEAQFSLFEYHLAPTFDLIQEILSNGSEFEVISPAWFRKKIQSEISKLARMYQ